MFFDGFPMHKRAPLLHGEFPLQSSCVHAEPLKLFVVSFFSVAGDFFSQGVGRIILNFIVNGIFDHECRSPFTTLSANTTPHHTTRHGIYSRIFSPIVGLPELRCRARHRR